MLNRLTICKNPFQGNYKKVLCVCSTGLLTSATAALVLSLDPFHFNTRAAGINTEFSLIPIDDVLLEWCDEVVCFTPEEKVSLGAMTDKKVICLRIEGSFGYRDKRLSEEIKIKYQQHLSSLSREEIDI